MWTSRRHLILLLSLFFVFFSTPLSAQRAWESGGLGLYGLGPRLGENITLALELESELGLSSDQVAALEDLALRVREEVSPLGNEIDALRSQILAGGITGAQGLLQLETLLNEYQAVADPYRAEVMQLLTPDQHRRLQIGMFETRTGPGRLLGWGAMGTTRGATPGVSTRLGLGFRAGAVGRGRGLGRSGRGYARGFVRGGRGYIRW